MPGAVSRTTKAPRKRRRRMTYARAIQILKKHGIFNEKGSNRASASFLLGAL